MSQQEDLLFCKIAIQSGLVTQEDARKCLVYAQKVESQGKPRPRIGSVLVKANLLTLDNARRVYQAVEKRSVSKGAPVRGRGGPRGRAPRAERRQPAALPRAERPRRRRAMDPKTLWVGIVSGVVLLFAVMLMFVMVINANRAETGTQVSAGEDSTSARSLQDPNAFKKSLLGGDDSQGSTVQDIPPDSETRRELEREHNRMVMDARSLRGDNFYRAIQMLTKFKEARKSRYAMFPDLRSTLDAEIADIEQEMKKELEKSLADAEELMNQGRKDEARTKLEAIRDKVDPDSKAIVNEKLEAVIGR